jgi:hypothetical protein
MAENPIGKGTEFAVLKGHGFPSRRYIESDCEGFLITVDTRRDEDALEAARHVSLVLNSHYDLLKACEEAKALLKEILYEVEVSREEARLVFPLDLIERLEKVAVKGKLPKKVTG